MSSDMNRYVAGFLFLNRNQVLLVRKNRPKWQNNLWNAVGGRVEQDETYKDAMIREFTEETGHTINDWTCFAIEHGRGYCVNFFYAHTAEYVAFQETNDVGELLQWHAVWSLYFEPPLIGNLHWLVPLALDWRTRVPHSFDFRSSDIKDKPTW